MNSMRVRGTDDQGCRRREGEAGYYTTSRGNISVSPNTGKVYTKLERIAQMARDDSNMKFKNLAHMLTPEFLVQSFKRLKKKAAPGIDEVTFEEFSENLPEHILDLHTRLKENRYRATPVKRIYIEKDGGGERPLGLPVLEDKIVQRAVVTILEAIYENDFHHFSFGFRKGRNQHQALGEFREGCLRNRVSWVVDMDVQGYFDRINHKLLLEFLRKRIADESILRLIGKWLKAGVVEEGELHLSEEGSPQGGVISPVLANVFLHYVLDEWFEKDIRPVLNAKGCMVRFADDSLVGFSSELDAKRFMKVLPKRFKKYGLTVHPEKTKLVRFVKPKAGQPKDKANGTFDFLGFTLYWGKTLSNTWAIKRKTSRKKLNVKMSKIWEWCKKHRHWSLREQHQILCAKLRGHYQYYGVRCNMRSLEKFLQHTRYCWRRWLGRRHRNGFIEWEKFQEKIEKYFPLPFPKIVHSI